MENFQKSLLLGIITFLVLSSLAIFYQEYDFFNQTYSQLGNGAGAIFFNFGLMITGALFAIYSYLLFLKKEKSKPFFLLCLISSIGLFGTGLFSLENILLHFLFAGTFFFSSSLLIFLKIIFSFKQSKHLFIFSLLIFLIVFCYMFFLRIPIMQKASVFAIILWHIYYVFRRN